MSRSTKIGSVLIAIILLSLLWYLMTPGLKLGEGEEDYYVQLNPLSVAAGDVCSIQMDTNLESFSVKVPEYILIAKDGILCSNKTVEFETQVTQLELLVPPTAEGQFPIVIERGSFEASFDFKVTDGTGSIVSGDDYYDHMRTITTRYAKRSTGLPHMSQAAGYLEDQLSSFGLEAEQVSFTRGGREVINVIGYHRGVAKPNEWIVLGGHYDIKEKTVEGAYDNAAGTVAVLEIARAVSRMKTDRTIVFCLWSGEEQGLWGSSHFVDNIPDNVTVKTYLNYDMVGLNWPQVYQLNVLVGPDEDANEIENPILLNISNRVINNILRYPAVGFDVKETGEGSSDQASFWPIGVPTIYYAGVIVYPGYHNKVDDLATMEVMAGGRGRLKDGFETVVWVSYYTTLLLDDDELVNQKEV
ncbi:MAG: M28 family peptidase [Thermoplasmata archaeon]|nr:MAG: M28 family peptidase [Thermoplasmata archaeon]